MAGTGNKPPKAGAGWASLEPASLLAGRGDSPTLSTVDFPKRLILWKLEHLEPLREAGNTDFGQL